MIFLMASLVIMADGEVRDSVRVKEVEITASRKKHFSDGYQHEEISGEISGSYSYRTLGEVLKHNANINIRSYGSAGASTSISFRGLGASQTQVNWNGFPINSVTLGSADVSNVMLLPNNSITMIPGAGGVTYGSGTFGGVVNIGFNPSGIERNNGIIDLNAASFGTFKVGGSYDLKINKLILSGSIWGDKSDADYKYFDQIKQTTLKRQNADYNQYGFQQYITYKPDAYSELIAGIWGQVKDMNIPAIEGASLKSYENQKDSTLRVFMSYKKVFERSSINIKGAWFYADQHYVQKDSADAPLTMIDSRIKSKSWFGDFNYRVYLIDRLSLDAGLTYNHTKGIVDAYEGTQNDEVIGLIAGVRYVNKLSANFALRKEWSNNVDSDILINTGFSFPLTKQFIVRGAYSQKFRRPTFNDLFWVPGGNPELLPERGYSIEIGGQYLIDSKTLGEFTTDLSVYYSPIENMIVWRPEGALWYAKNYSDVLTRGIDLKLMHHKKINTITWKTTGTLGYNQATIESIAENNKSKEGRPLYYAPKWMSNINSGITTENDYQFFVSWNFASEQSYDDSDDTIEPYWLLNAQIAKNIKIKRSQLFAQVSVENLFNKSYQTVRSYPMPGRMWHIKLKYLIN